MSQKLLTLQELSEDLGIKESKIEDLVKEKAIFAYKIGGELLRFRKEQIDAQRKEILARCGPSDMLDAGGAKDPAPEEPLGPSSGADRELSSAGQWRDMLYFYDFYIIAAIIALVLLYFIFRN